MQHRIFFDHYRICEDFAGSPEEIGRTGAAIVYKARDTRSKKNVVVQLIPLASIDPATREQFEERARSAQKLDHVNIARVLEVGTESDFLVLVSEFIEGETTDAWVVGNGPMPPEAALRVGLEVVRALEAAAFFSLTHRALQPSNIMIVPGTAPDGGWPFVKLLNFGLAGAESHAPETPGAALAPAIPPQFASPEQLRNEALDFRSEVYSLAATMCFLLTGAAPLADGVHGRLGRFPELRRLPRAWRNLLSAMLSEKPEQRPQDPVALQKEMLNSLAVLERRQAVRRKLGIPQTVALPRVTRSATPSAQILRGAIAFALLLLVGAGVTAAFFPQVLHFNRSANEIGVPIGVPQSSANTAVAQTSPDRATSTVTPASTVVAANESTSATPLPSAQPSGSPEIASANSTAQPQSPAEGPEDNSTAATTDSTNQSVAANSAAPNESTSEPKTTNSSESTEASPSRTETKTTPSVNSSRRSRIARDDENESSDRRDLHSSRGSFRARVIGQTPDGRPILRLPSGRVVIVRRGAPIEDYYSQPRRRAIVHQPEFDERPPLQPFNYQPED
jgi:serine/threonine protein kinase